MQAIPLQIIAPQTLTTTLASYYESPAKKKTIISKLTLTNTSAAAETVDVHLVPSGGVADATNRVISTKTLDINEAWPAYQMEGQVLSPGDAIHAIAGGASAIIIVASGVEVF